MFLCGVEVELSFSALFSNVLVAFATVKTTGPRTQDCTVILSSRPVNIYFYLKLSIFLSSFAVIQMERICRVAFIYTSLLIEERKAAQERNITFAVVHSCLLSLGTTL